MNLQDKINLRESLTDEQLYTLYEILSARQSKIVKTKIFSLLNTKYYTIFDESPMAKCFIIHNGDLRYKEYSDMKISEIRKEILKYAKEE